MTALQQRLYRLLVRLHPAEFRHEFGRDMERDFKDAAAHTNLATLYIDALMSLVRQWAESAVSGDADRSPLQKASLLSGQYVVFGDEGLSPLELGRGLVAAVALAALLAAAQRFSPTPAIASGFASANDAPPTGDEGPSGNPAEISTGRARGLAKLREVVSNQRGPSPNPASGLAFSLATRRGAYAQNPHPIPAEKKPFQQFDVASVRENRSNTPAGEVSMNFPLNREGYAKTGGVFRVTNFPLNGYLSFAYHLTVTQSSALGKQLPDWAKSARYDIEARVEGEPSKDDMRTMLRALLAERFALAVHTGTREIAVFDMKLARPGKTGPTLTPHPADDPNCLGKPPGGFFSPCNTVGFMFGAPIKLGGRNIPLQVLADNLNAPAGRPVVDKTGLTGTWDINLSFAADPDPGAPAPPEPTPPPFAQAISEQAGLKLVPAKSQAVVYLLDRIDRPTGN